MIKTNSAHQFLAITLMMVAALFLQELPRSNTVQQILPEWPFLLMLYFSVSTRSFFGVFSAFVVGLLEDVFLNVPTIGIHAGIYVSCSFIIIINRLRFMHFGLAQQAIFIACLVALKICIYSIYETVFFSPPHHLWPILSVPLSALSWPLIYLFFQFFTEKTGG